MKLVVNGGSGGGNELVYITARDVMDRLDDVFGVEGWSDDYEWLGDRLMCKISCRLNGSGWVTKSDGAEDSNIEAIKGAYSDSFKVLLSSGELLGIYSTPVLLIATSNLHRGLRLKATMS